MQDPEDSVARVLNRIIAENGRVRLMRHPISVRALAQYLLPAALAGVWLWAQLTTSIPLPVAVAGWIGVVLAFGFTVPNYRRVATARTQEISPYPGHRVQHGNRAERAQRAANRRRDIFVAAITAVASVLASVIVLYLTGVISPTP